jgi:hypothetical protein
VSGLGADHGPIDPAARDDMNALAQALDVMFNGPELPGLPRQKQVGFFLTCYPFGEPGRFNYISNTDKLDVRAMLKEITARIEGRLGPEGHA